MGSGLVEEKATAYLDLLILSQVHLVEELERELGGLFLIHLSPEARALEEGNGYHVVVKFPSLLSVHANDDSVEEVTDTRVIDLDSQSCRPTSTLTRT